MERLRSIPLLSLLILLVLSLAACGMQEQPAPDPDTTPGHMDTFEDGSTDTEGDQKKDGDDGKDGPKVGDGEDEPKDDDKAEVPGKPDDAMLECAYLADLEGRDGWKGEMGEAADAPWTLLDVEVELYEDEAGVDTVSWSLDEEDDVRVMAVKVYGGKNPHTYLYLEEETRADDGLVAEPWGKEQKPAEVTHVIVCVTYPKPDKPEEPEEPEFEPGLDKTAEADLAIDWAWALDKEVVHDEEAGELVYTLDIGATPAFAAAVSGTVTITNPHDLPMTVKAMSDRLAFGEDHHEDVELTCELGEDAFVEGDAIPAGESVECTYDHPLEEYVDGVNKAAVHYAYEVDGETFTGTLHAKAPFSFDGIDADVTDATAYLTDELTHAFDGTDEIVGLLGEGVQTEFTATLEGDNAWSESYVYELPVELACGDHVFTNDAVLHGDDEGVLASDGTTYTLTIACEYVGCTLTQGYWKNHSMEGEPDRDPTWDELPDGEGTEFFDSGLTYYEVLTKEIPEEELENPENWFWNLGRQYIAAELNTLAGASMPEDVQEMFEAAGAIFLGASPDDEAPEGWEAAKNVLDAYNNGGEGVPHCDGFDDGGDVAAI